tara:strand:- start:490 stop:1005 length:516 start_codon:yes stop_codon:yes gene_type:complete
MTTRLIPLILATLLLAGSAAAGPRTVVVTFDDLPYQGEGRRLCDREQALALTREFLTMLEPLDAHATAFVNEGKVCEARRDDVLPAVLNLWLDAGIDLGNHTFSHINPHQTTAQTWLDDVDRGARSRGRCWPRAGGPCTGSAIPICSPARRRTSMTPWPPVWQSGATMSRR